MDAAMIATNCVRDILKLYIYMLKNLKLLISVKINGLRICISFL